MIESLHISRYIHVGSTGGTERYLLDLVRALRHAGHQVRIGWVGEREEGEFVDAEGFTITPFTVPPGFVDAPSASMTAAFRGWLAAHRPAVVHFHTFSLSEAMMAQVARDLGIRYVFTYHSPSWSCRRGDLLRWGSTLCDGEIRVWRCSACLIQNRVGCLPSLAWAATGLMAPLGLVGRFASGSLHRRTAYLEDTARFRKAFRLFLGHAAKVVACAEWSIPVLERNGASSAQIVHCPQGVAMDFVDAAKCRSQKAGKDRRSGLFTVGYVGRVTSVKGVHILVEAFSKTKYPNARLRINGWEDSKSNARYRRLLQKLAGNDPRIEWIPKLSFDAMFEEYRKLDLLALPSVWLETGPLTLLEGLEQGVTVWGSNRIGQIDCLRRNGRVIYPNTPDAWRTELDVAFGLHQAGCWPGLRKTPNLRTMAMVGNEMAELYDGICC